MELQSLASEIKLDKKKKQKNRNIKKQEGIG